MGLSWFELKNGSWALAGFPISGSALENETADQAMAKRGFDRYKEGH